MLLDAIIVFVVLSTFTITEYTTSTDYNKLESNPIVKVIEIEDDRDTLDTLDTLDTFSLTWNEDDRDEFDIEDE